MSTNLNSSSEDPKEPIKLPNLDGDNGQSDGSPPISRNRKGQFLPGSVPNPKGRAKGCLNQATIFARALLEEAAPEVARRAITDAKAGKQTALKLVLERVIPIASDRRVLLDQLTQSAKREDRHSPDDLTPRDVMEAHNHLVRAVAQGELSPIEAQAISQLLEARRRSWESLELSRRLNDLEEQMAKSPKRRH